MQKDYIYKRKDGGTTYCYGQVKQDSNFSLVCDNEFADGIYTDYEGKLHWFYVCKHLEENYNSQIEEITAI